MDIHQVINSCYAWHGQKQWMMEACKKEVGSTPVMMRYLFRSKKTTAAVLEFINTMNADRGPYE